MKNFIFYNSKGIAFKIIYVFSIQYPFNAVAVWVFKGKLIKIDLYLSILDICPSIKIAKNPCTLVLQHYSLLVSQKLGEFGVLILYDCSSQYAVQHHAEQSVVYHKSSPCFYVFELRATAPLLDIAFSLSPLRISRNHTMTEVPVLRFLTFIDRLLGLPSRFLFRKCIEFIASCQRSSGLQLPPYSIWFHACFARS